MIFEFQDCWLDDDACELRRGDEAVALQPKVLEVLLYLIRHRDRVVPKNELLDQVWKDVAVGDGVLTRAVNLARAAVGDAGREQTVIRTLSRKGYRFCAEVRLREGDGTPLRSNALQAVDRAFTARDWRATLAALEAAEAEAPLQAAELEMQAWSLLWEARFAESTTSFERAHAAYEEAGDREAALEHAERAIEIARRQGNRDVEALGQLDRGHCLLATGRIDEAIALHDEVAALAMGGGLGVQATGTIYCSVIWGCRNRGDWERASQLTDHSIRWCQNTHVAQFPGLCTLHRAEVLRLRGEFEDAEREVLRACDDLLLSMAFVAGDAFNELGEIRLRRGEFSGAREAFRRAVELGNEPEPGLARLRIEDGDVEGALKGLARSLDRRGLNAQERRVLLLAGQIEAALAAGQRDLARAALQHLEDAPELWSSPAHNAEVGG